ncbi:MAG: zf-HC2 domain-containing protein [Elusimicrobia bacterium]|nr:zf-HC2 domain-containing protein [Elusimicrobiota bacterium]
MNCNKAQELISQYIDNKLSAQSVSELQKHFEECSKCKQDYIMLKNIKAVLSKTPKKELSSDFTASVMNKIKNENVKKDDNVVMFGSFFNSFKKKMVMAAGFLFIVASSTFFFMHGPTINQQNGDSYASSGMEYYFGYNSYYDSDMDDDDYEEYISMFC